MNWIYYLLEANLYLTAFYALYYLILKNETYYQLNRVYLLFTSILAFLIPFLQLGFLKPVYRTVAPVIVPTQQPITITLLPPVHQANWSLADYLLTAYISVSSLLAIHLVIKIYSLIRLSYQNKTIINNTYRLIEIGSGANAFSFFNYLFISSDQPQKQTVINHELIHIQQKHSWDILYLQLLKIVNWFNPVVYLLQHSIKEQHEFIADREAAAREGNTSSYATFLLNNVYGMGQSGLTNNFFNKSLLKKRIIMLHQKPSGNLARLKYLAALPVCAGLICASTLAFSKSYGWIDLVPKPKNDTTNSKKTEHDSDYVNINTFTNAKGYKVEEKIAAHDGNLSREATITDKQGNIHIFYDEKITPADRKMLLETYGYAFPKMKITGIKLTPPPIDSSKPLPPPPPIPPRKHSKKSNNRDNKAVTDAPSAPLAPPAPAMPPAPPGKTSDKIAAPQIPLETLRDSTTKAKPNKVTYQPSQQTPGNPVIVINGKRYFLKEKLKHGQTLICSADTVSAYVADGVDYPKQFGDDAKNGVIVMSGKNPSVIVR